MSNEKDILRHCGDMGKSDSWVTRLQRVNALVDCERIHSAARAQAIADADIPQKYRDVLADAIKRAERKADAEIAACVRWLSFAERGENV